MRLVVTGGGTGGHIYPAVEVAGEMCRLVPRSAVLYVGTEAGMESRIVRREGLAFATVRSSGVIGKSPLVAAKGLARATAGLSDAAAALRSFRPDVVLGTGGYVSGPVVLAAYLLRIPRAIQEQNAVPGKTNRVLSRISNRVYAAWDYSRRFFPETARVSVTGNPVRARLLEATRLEGRSHYGIPEDATVVLVLGGSRGAKTLAEAGVRLASALDGAWMIAVTGTEYYGRVVSELAATPESGIDGARAGNVIIRPYEHKIAMAYRAADIVICRGGGMTLSEVTALGLPSVVVPSPNVAGNHQEHNARALAEAGAATVVREEGDAVAAISDAALCLVRDEDGRSQMREAALRLGRPDAAREMCRDLLSLARKRR